MLATAALSIAAVSGLLKPKVALAASGLKDVFRTSTGRDALQALFPDQTLTPSDELLTRKPRRFISIAAL